MPVLPEVASMSVSPGLIVPRFSASTTIDSAGRSLTDPAGLLPSSFASRTLEVCPGRRCSRTSGVLPTVSSMVRYMARASPRKANPLLYRRQKPRHAGGVSKESRRGYFFAFSSALALLSLSVLLFFSLSPSFAALFLTASSSLAFFLAAFSSSLAFFLAAFSSAFAFLSSAAFIALSSLGAAFSSFAVADFFSSAFIALSSFFASVFAGAGAGGAAAGAPLASGALEGAAGGGAFDSLAALLSCATGVDAPVTEILSLSGPKVPSLMPGTFMMSSGVLNGPFLAR